jgi:hypothetical protein
MICLGNLRLDVGKILIFIVGMWDVKFCILVMWLMHKGGNRGLFLTRQ